MKTKITYFLIAAFIIAGCSKDEQPADSRVRVWFCEDTLVTMSSVHVTIYDGESAWEFKPHNFKRTASDSNCFSSPEVQTQSSGVLEVLFHLDKIDGTTFCDGAFSAHLSPNWRWSFEILHAITDSTWTCIDCIHTTMYEIYDQAHSNESIYVLWRGRGP